MSQDTNGSGNFGPSGMATVLLKHAEDLGSIKSTIKYHDRRLSKLENKAFLGLSYVNLAQIAAGLGILAAAVSGRISWGQAFELGKMIGGG